MKPVYKDIWLKIDNNIWFTLTHHPKWDNEYTFNTKMAPPHRQGVVVIESELGLKL